MITKNEFMGSHCNLHFTLTIIRECMLDVYWYAQNVLQGRLDQNCKSDLTKIASVKELFCFQKLFEAPGNISSSYFAPCSHKWYMHFTDMMYVIFSCSSRVFGKMVTQLLFHFVMHYAFHCALIHLNAFYADPSWGDFTVDEMMKDSQSILTIQGLPRQLLQTKSTNLCLY